ncbi:hypothetical protein RvY_17179 [Ramazzottius varieornatus]|uniref:MARVEL domain-containing protein n=1 Tax=Ramazzottius varieornatus TaxID=947166 RepID=A0A1D1W196_RAMVA|nr:hypothetical protein RvY_17179 [Ramazzottius varieornatus]
MFSAEDATRRATLKAFGSIQMFLGVTEFCGAIAVVSMSDSDNPVDKTYAGFWSSLFYVFLGLLSVVGSRFVEGAPPRGVLLACVILNSIVAVLSIIVVILFIVALSVLDNTSFGQIPNNNNAGCYDIVLTYAKTILVDNIIRMALIIPICIAAAAIAKRIRNATVITTTHHITYSAPAQPYVVTSANPGYSAAAPGYPAGSGPYPGHPSA